MINIFNYLDTFWRIPIGLFIISNFYCIILMVFYFSESRKIPFKEFLKNKKSDFLYYRGFWDYHNWKFNYVLKNMKF
jgi:hypothetical protein